MVGDYDLMLSLLATTDEEVAMPSSIFAAYSLSALSLLIKKSLLLNQWNASSTAVLLRFGHIVQQYHVSGVVYSSLYPLSNPRIND
jgi:hypothetical protein